jgi:asparagine synthase (glutamine-hydrolysing)
VLDKTSAAFSIQTRYPFWDKRLMEFCLAIPPDQTLFRSWGRIVLRRAMDGILPPEVQWRRDKTDFTPNFLHGLLDVDRECLDDVIWNDSTALQEFIDISAMQDVYRRFISRKHQNSVQETVDARTILKAVSLSRWLHNQGRSSPRNME